MWWEGGRRIQNGRCSGFLSLLLLVLRKIKKAWKKKKIKTNRPSSERYLASQLSLKSVWAVYHLTSTELGFILPCQSRGELLPSQLISGSVPSVVGVQAGHHGLFQHKPSGAGEGLSLMAGSIAEATIESHSFLLASYFHKHCSMSVPSDSHKPLFLPRLIIRYWHYHFCISLLSPIHC